MGEELIIAEKKDVVTIADAIRAKIGVTEEMTWDELVAATLLAIETVVTDTTLTQSGVAADAKAVGDAIKGKSDSTHTHTATEVGADVSGAAENALTESKTYTDTKIANLINGAPTTLDTLSEIATAMAENEDVVEALESAIGNKSDKTHTHTINDITDSTSKAGTGMGAEVFNNYNPNPEEDGYVENVASGDYSHAEGEATTASAYAAHAEGYWSTASGDYSHAEGNDTLAQGENSHAEGKRSKATGGSSHAEGEITEATNDGAHAEGGNTKATGLYSHAEGYNSEAQGDSSHAEGNSNIASGHTSHAEGYGTRASQEAAHAEGYCTIAASQNQHVQGKYNIEDATNKYAHIVGNGDYNARSNAHTVDWDGNGWFNGDVYVGSTSGTNKDDGSKKLLKEGDLKTEILTITYEDGSTRALEVYVK